MEVSQFGGLELQKNVHGGIQRLVTHDWCMSCAVQGRKVEAS